MSSMRKGGLKSTLVQESNFVDVHNKTRKVTSLQDKLKIMAAGYSERARANGIAVSMYKPCENWICLLPMTLTLMQAFDCGCVGMDERGKIMPPQ